MKRLACKDMTKEFEDAKVMLAIQIRNSSDQFDAPPRTLLKNTVKMGDSRDTEIGFFSDIIISAGSIREVREEIYAAVEVIRTAIDTAAIYKARYFFLMLRMEYSSPYTGVLRCWLGKNRLENLDAEQLTAAGQKPEHWLFVTPMVDELRDRCRFDSIYIELTNEEKDLWRESSGATLIKKNRDVFPFTSNGVSGSLKLTDDAYVYHITWKYMKPAPIDFLLYTVYTVAEGNSLPLTVTLWGEFMELSNPLFNRQFSPIDMLCGAQWTCECGRCGSKKQKEVKIGEDLQDFLQNFDSGCECPIRDDMPRAFLSGEKRFYI